MKCHPLTFATVPRLWPGETFVCLGSGPSLTADDVAFCRGKARVIAVNDTYQVAPWADVLYACDEAWWNAHNGVPSFHGLKYSLNVSNRWPDVQRLKQTGRDGLELNPSGLRTGKNSGYQAIGLARHLGAARIILLGYDMKIPAKGPIHFFGEHRFTKVRPDVMLFRPFFNTLVAPLKAEGIEIVNCTRDTDLTCFPRQALDVALAPARPHVAA